MNSVLILLSFQLAHHQTIRIQTLSSLQLADFKTDAQISSSRVNGGSGGRGGGDLEYRELVEWEADDDDPASNGKGDSLQLGGAQGWSPEDMFRQVSTRFCQ